MNHSVRCSLALSLCLPLLGCPEDDDSDTSETQAMTTAASSTGTPDPTTGGEMTTGNTTGAGTTEGPSATSSTTAAAESSGDSTEGIEPPIFDLGIIPDFMPIEEDCGQVDFLFIIDNSGSMGDEQAELVASFPVFINSIQNVLEGVESYQVGVVTTDAYSPNIAGCNQLSSLVVQTGGSNSSNAVCGPYAAGDNFMTEADDLATAFSCAAQVGTVGSATERPMQAMVEAVTRVEGGPGECNEGFIRDDALLVVVIITDEPDNASTGSPMTWYDDVVAAKLGIPENVVVLSIINTPGGACGSAAPDIAAFTTMFGVNGFMSDICVPDFAMIFDQAVGIVDIACDNYIPPR